MADFALMARTIDAQRARAAITRWRASGLSIAEFLRGEGLGRRTFYRWRAHVEASEAAAARGVPVLTLPPSVRFYVASLRSEEPLLLYVDGARVCEVRPLDRLANHKRKRRALPRPEPAEDGLLISVTCADSIPTR